MKSFRVLLIVALCVTCFLFSGVVYALDANDVSVTVNLSTETAYTGGLLGLRISVTSNHFEQITLGYLGIHFDWMAVDYFEGQNMSDNLVPLTYFETFLSNVIVVYIPENVTAGVHSYYVGIDGLESDSTGFSWDSMLFTLTVQEPEQVYDELLTNVSSGISAGENANYQSSEAKSLLGQAQDAYSQAVGLASDNNFIEAIPVLQDASVYLDQAEVEEQNYAESIGLFVKVLIVVGVLVAVLVAVLWYRQKQKKVSRRKRRMVSKV